MQKNNEASTKTVVIANTKGGVGKTTTAIMLAIALAHTYSVEVRDTDPQGSASEWIDRAKNYGEDVPFTFAIANRRTLAHPSSAQWVIIDTPPGDPETLNQALKIADFTIIPTASTPLDMERMWATYETTEGKDRATLITKAFSRTRALTETIELFDEEKVPYFDTIIYKREDIAKAFGHTAIDELHGYEHVATELVEALK